MAARILLSLPSPFVFSYIHISLLSSFVFSYLLSLLSPLIFSYIHPAIPLMIVLALSLLSPFVCTYFRSFVFSYFRPFVFSCIQPAIPLMLVLTSILPLIEYRCFVSTPVSFSACVSVCVLSLLLSLSAPPLLPPILLPRPLFPIFLSWLLHVFFGMPPTPSAPPYIFGLANFFSCHGIPVKEALG
jgi:hypothetical protein